MLCIGEGHSGRRIGDRRAHDDPAAGGRSKLDPAAAGYAEAAGAEDSRCAQHGGVYISPDHRDDRKWFDRLLPGCGKATSGAPGGFRRGDLAVPSLPPRDRMPR
ncbi:hypothetical protein GOOTI_082_00150 [Gordonia otitidis NBRC 100426]|uniref:Uncharacterized protein n=1 Tax=Gordonia otitidis (strain DSM 44809 / CCUG 52243 / JCM 12355 / NBRC 100426 / IFM 10032) TaxID=1108044 RepID=H5TJX7_GORO1|nr:hypothetical protein GOOTI_082_00150 [Gordonia otitidis NBRC 100426]